MRSLLNMPENKIFVNYSSGTSPALGPAWDVMQVRYRSDDGDRNSFVIARDAGGKILRRTDLSLEQWEVVNNADDLREFRRCFDDRDKLAAEAAANPTVTAVTLPGAEDPR
jgi:hypothetical protein